MARDHARLQTARNRDRDWRDLTVDAQWAYDTVLTQEGITYVGVLDYFPGRIAALAKGMTAKRVETAVRGLEEGRFVVVDRDTQELCVRTFVRHDGVLARANMGKAMGRALAKVVSLDVRDTVLDELAKCYRDDNTASGWDGFRELFPDDFDDVVARASRMPLRMASGM